MSDQNSVVVVSKNDFKTGRTTYLSQGWLSPLEQEVYENGKRPLFSRLKNQLSDYQAKKSLENQSENKEVKEIVFSTKQFNRLGTSEEERLMAFKNAVRDSVSQILKETGHERAPWVAAVHQNKEYEHAHVLIAKHYTDEKTGEVKQLPQYLPKQLFEKENGTTNLTAIFQSNLEKRFAQLDYAATYENQHQSGESEVQTNNFASVQSVQKNFDNYFPTEKLIVQKPNKLLRPNIDANQKIKNNALETGIQQIQTLPADADVLNGERAFIIRQERTARELQKLRAESQKREQFDAQQLGAKKERVSAGDRQETEELKDVAVERVFAEWGLFRSPKHGKNTWISGDGEHKINVIKGNRFADVAAGKSKRDDNYLPDISRSNAINAVIYLSAGAMDFAEARLWMKDRFGQATSVTTNKKQIDDSGKAVQNDASQLPENAVQNVDSNRHITARSDDKPIPLEVPAFDDSRLKQIEHYLKNERQISDETVALIRENGSLKANDKGSGVFVMRDFAGKTTGYSLRSTWSGFRQNTEGTSKEIGWFYLGNPQAAKEITVVEAPIEALSYYDLNRAASWKDKAIIALNGASVQEELIEQLKQNDSLEKVTVALNSDEPGQRAARKIAHKFADELPHITVKNTIPATEEDWNDYLRATTDNARQPIETKPPINAVEFNKATSNDPTQSPNFFKKLIDEEATYRKEALTFWNEQQRNGANKPQDSTEQPAENKEQEAKVMSGISNVNATNAQTENLSDSNLINQQEVESKPIQLQPAANPIVSDEKAQFKIGLTAAGEARRVEESSEVQPSFYEESKLKRSVISASENNQTINPDSTNNISNDLKQLTATADRELRNKHQRFGELISSPAYLTAKPFLEKTYQVNSDAILIEELQHKILKGESTRIGLNPEQAIEFGNAWIQSVAERSPNLTTEQFKEKANESRELREEIYGRIAAERINHELERRGLAETFDAARSRSNCGAMVDGLSERHVQREAGSVISSTQVTGQTPAENNQTYVSAKPPTPTSNSLSSPSDSPVNVDELKTEWHRRDAEQQKKDRQEWQAAFNQQKNVQPFIDSAGDQFYDAQELWQQREDKLEQRDKKELEKNLNKLKIPTAPGEANKVLIDIQSNPQTLVQNVNGKLFNNLTENGTPRTWIRTEQAEVANVFILTTTKDSVNPLTLVEKETRLSEFKGNHEDFKAYVAAEKMSPVSASFGIERLESGKTSIYLLVDQTKRNAVFAGTEESVEKFAATNFVKFTDQKNNTTYFKVAKSEPALFEQPNLSAANEQKPTNFFAETAELLRKADDKKINFESENRANINREDKQFTWIDGNRTISEATSVDNLKERFWQLAAHKTEKLLEKAYESQNNLDPQFRLPLDTLKNLFVEKQYNRETEPLNFALNEENKTTNDRLHSAQPHLEQTRDELLKRLESAAATTVSGTITNEQSRELIRDAKELAFALRSRDTHLAIHDLANKFLSEDKTDRADLQREAVHAGLLKSEAAFSKTLEDNFELRGKTERFIITDEQNRLLSRNEIVASPIKKDEEKTADVNVHGWSLKDVAESRQTLQKEVEMLEFIEQNQKKSVLETKTGINETVKNIFLPSLNLEGRLKPFTDFENWVKSSLDPLARLKAHPAVKLMDAWSARAGADERLAATVEQLEKTRERLGLIEEKVAPAVENKFEIKQQLLKERTGYLQDFADKVQQNVNAKELRFGEKINPQWKQVELEQLGENAARAGSTENLMVYFREKKRSLENVDRFAAKLDALIKPEELKLSGIEPNAKFNEHLSELSGTAASADQINKLRLKGVETSDLTALTANLELARAENKLAEWLKTQSRQAEQRIEAATEKTILERLLGKQELVKAQKEERLAWHDREFQIKDQNDLNRNKDERGEIRFGNAYTEPLMIKENGRSTVVTITNLLRETNINGEFIKSVELANDAVNKQKDLSNIQIARFETAEERLSKAIVETAQKFNQELTGKERKLLTEREISALADSLARNPRIINNSNDSQPRNGLNEVSSNLQNVASDKPIVEKDRVIFNSAAENQIARKEESKIMQTQVSETIKVHPELAQTIQPAIRRARLRM